jgi:hypothetical protein
MNACDGCETNVASLIDDGGMLLCTECATIVGAGQPTNRGAAGAGLGALGAQGLAPGAGSSMSSAPGLAPSGLGASGLSGSTRADSGIPWLPNPFLSTPTMRSDG